MKCYLRFLSKIGCSVFGSSPGREGPCGLRRSCGCWWAGPATLGFEPRLATLKTMDSKLLNPYLFHL